MPIAYHTGEYPRATDTFIQREVAALRRMGVDVTTFSVRRPASSEHVGQQREEEARNTHYLLPVSPIALLLAHLHCLRRPARYFAALRRAIRLSPGGLKPFLYQLFYFAEAALLAHQLNRRNIRHLHNHYGNSSCTVAMLAAELANLPYSFTLHGSAIFFEPMYWRLDEKISRARFVACISHFSRSQGMIFADQQHWPRMHVVHCGIQPDDFQPRTHEGPARHLLFVGRLVGVKGLPYLLDAMQQLVETEPALQLTLVGDGPDRHALQRDVEARGLAANVHFVGYKSPDEVRQLLQTTDIFVLPSFAEGVPVVLMEALAAGVPVVATRVGGIWELVEENGSGLLVRPGDADMLAQAIQKLARDPDLRQRFAEQGRRHVEAEFDAACEARKLHTLFHQSLAQTEAEQPADESPSHALAES